jgi:hypothetical protein
MPETHSQPLVSCVMPTYNRRQFVPYAIKYFLRQDYENKELIIIDDGADAVKDLVPDLPGIRYYRHDRKITLGAKLNLACQYAEGSIIVHWDDDDWYAPWRLKYQVQSLQEQQVGVCGINKLLYYDFRNKKAYQYIYPPDQRKWLLGSSLCYTKQLWRNNRFAEIDVGMDGLFVWNTPPQHVSVLDNYNFSVHMIHSHNISPKQTSGTWWHSFPEEEIKRVMGADWHAYTENGAEVKNIYACLVHESEDCIRDMVHNLYYNDPSSVILLYNGGTNPNLIPPDIAGKYGVVVHPKPVSAKHGYLHRFALDCMEFSLNNFDFNTLTIVDSDQLSIRPGYSKFLGAYMHPDTGMFSNKPERVDANNKTNAVALQAFREYDLWKPLLHTFEKGEEKFVHWTFWPSTVFMADAAKDLVKIFKENATLQHIMQHSKIWASEEVILPTLVRLLGYEIRTNPCSYEFVKYKLPMNTADVRSAFAKDNAYWIHPVARTFNDPVRAFVREKFSKYDIESTKPVQKETPAIEAPKAISIIEKISRIEGWLSAAEASLLAGVTEKALSSLKPPHVIAEVGSYHGKSTVVFGSVITEKFPGAVIVAMDPHDGKLGAADQGLKQFPPSLEMFKRNIQTAGLAAVVEVVPEQCRNVQWNRPVSILFVDGLHDYMNVSRDFMHFENWLVKGAFIAFHDYADYFPGVKNFVNELSGTLQYKKIAVADSLIVLQKL